MEHLRELISRLQELRSGFHQHGEFDIVLGPRMRIKDPSSETASRFVQATEELISAGVTWATVNIAHDIASLFNGLAKQLPRISANRNVPIAIT